MIEREKRTVGEVHKQLVERLGDMIDEYFHVANRYDKSPGFNITAESDWPEQGAKWIACYAVTGSNEGHYIHVDCVYNDQTRDMIFLGKTFQGMDHAQRIACICAEELGA